MLLRKTITWTKTKQKETMKPNNTKKGEDIRQPPQNKQKGILSAMYKHYTDRDLLQRRGCVSVEVSIFVTGISALQFSFAVKASTYCTMKSEPSL